LPGGPGLPSVARGAGGTGSALFALRTDDLTNIDPIADACGIINGGNPQMVCYDVTVAACSIGWQISSACHCAANCDASWINSADSRRDGELDKIARCLNDCISDVDCVLRYIERFCVDL
jgi:hypothetical protein